MILFLQTFKIRPGPWIIYWIWYQNMRSRLWWWPIDHIHIIQRSSKIIFSLFTFVWTTTGSARHQQLRASSSYLRTWNQKAPNLHHCTNALQWQTGVKGDASRNRKYPTNRVTGWIHDGARSPNLGGFAACAKGIQILSSIFEHFQDLTCQIMR